MWLQQEQVGAEAGAAELAVDAVLPSTYLGGGLVHIPSGPVLDEIVGKQRFNSKAYSEKRFTMLKSIKAKSTEKRQQEVCLCP